MIGDMESNKELKPIVSKLFIRGRKLNFSLVFLSQSYFTVPKNIQLDATHYFIMKTLTKENSNKQH